LFIDCSGFAALLVGRHYGVKMLDRSNVVLNDRALAAQVPVLPGSMINSVTISTAQTSGWTWDIGLPTRRGIGYVHSSQFCDEAEAEATLRGYIARAVPGADVDALNFRLIKFPTGYRETFWVRNCLAIGLSAGFIEPLESSSIVSIEHSVRALTQNFPMRRSAIPRMAGRFNELFRYQWERIIDFIKLHYLPTQRTEPYWQAHRDPSAVPEHLAELMELWRDQPPSHWDVMMQDEIFSHESYQYVYYGMRGPLPPELPMPANADALLAEVQQNAAKFAQELPTNRFYLDTLRASRQAATAAS
jgi:hypothetical protein